MEADLIYTFYILVFFKENNSSDINMDVTIKERWLHFIC